MIAFFTCILHAELRPKAYFHASSQFLHFQQQNALVYKIQYILYIDTFQVAAEYSIFILTLHVIN